MKRVLFYALYTLLIANLPCMGQTVINREGAIKSEPYTTPYDSLSNFRKFKHDDREDYYHLVGQTALYIGEPYSTGKSNGLTVGQKYLILDVLPDENWNGALCYLKVKNTRTKNVIRVDPGLLDRCNISWVVNGYVEKLYSIYSGSSYMYFGSSNYSHNNADYLINCKTNTINKDIPDETIWKFIEIQILPRLKNDGMELDSRCGIVFVLENEQYGRYYVYYEDSEGHGASGPFNRLFKRIKPISDADISGLRVGMTETECKELLGEPIGKSISITLRNGRTEKKERLRFSRNIYITIENGIVKDIEVQN